MQKIPKPSIYKKASRSTGLIKCHVTDFEALTKFAKTGTHGLPSTGNREWVRKAISILDRASQTTGSR